ncbi:hypothetical protein [Mangrovicoccus algicola]|uniref:Uncharacterized protein n=1 Tax=Mangrovicoccus algicola TaxID=2771008 RepID=A0A8J6YPG0_9RHOB|nr:hypothetical protein [Mangrovicoccus algicola]MBE3636963.1 hypothetical protein [Mangrovicoccus algicola]
MVKNGAFSESVQGSSWPPAPQAETERLAALRVLQIMAQSVNWTGFGRLSGWGLDPFWVACGITLLSSAPVRIEDALAPLRGGPQGRIRLGPGAVGKTAPIVVNGNPADMFVDSFLRNRNLP